MHDGLQTVGSQAKWRRELAGKCVMSGCAAWSSWQHKHACCQQQETWALKNLSLLKMCLWVTCQFFSCFCLYYPESLSLSITAPVMTCAWMREMFWLSHIASIGSKLCRRGGQLRRCSPRLIWNELLALDPKTIYKLATFLGATELFWNDPPSWVKNKACSCHRADFQPGLVGSFLGVDTFWNSIHLFGRFGKGIF